MTAPTEDDTGAGLGECGTQRQVWENVAHRGRSGRMLKTCLFPLKMLCADGTEESWKEILRPGSGPGSSTNSLSTWEVPLSPDVFVYMVKITEYFTR